MPASEDALTEETVLNTLAFIRSTWSERAQEVQCQRTLGRNDLTTPIYFRSVPPLNQ